MKKTHYYGITWNLTVRDLGNRATFDSADEYAKKTSAGDGDEVMYIAQRVDLIDLRKRIDEILS